MVCQLWNQIIQSQEEYLKKKEWHFALKAMPELTKFPSDLSTFFKQ
jgi:hypothetical protein